MKRIAVLILAALLTACGGGDYEDDEADKPGTKPPVCKANPNACL